MKARRAQILDEESFLSSCTLPSIDIPMSPSPKNSGSRNRTSITSVYSVSPSNIYSQGRLFAAAPNPKRASVSQWPDGALLSLANTGCSKIFFSSPQNLSSSVNRSSNGAFLEPLEIGLGSIVNASSTPLRVLSKAQDNPSTQELSSETLSEESTQLYGAAGLQKLQTNRQPGLSNMPIVLLAQDSAGDFGKCGCPKCDRTAFQLQN